MFVVFIIFALAYVGLYGTMLVVKYQSDKATGPLPGHPAYDRAREERVWREQSLQNKEKVSVQIKGLDPKDFV